MVDYLGSEMGGIQVRSWPYIYHCSSLDWKSKGGPSFSGGVQEARHSSALRLSCVPYAFLWLIGGKDIYAHLMLTFFPSYSHTIHPTRCQYVLRNKSSNHAGPTPTHHNSQAFPIHSFEDMVGRWRSGNEAREWRCLYYLTLLDDRSAQSRDLWSISHWG